MKILESLEDNEGRIYAIVKHSKKDQELYKSEEYEAMYLLDGELHSFGGTVGYNVADFPTYEKAQQFVLTGFSQQDEFPDIWLDMLQVQKPPSVKGKR